MHDGARLAELEQQAQCYAQLAVEVLAEPFSLPLVVVVRVRDVGSGRWCDADPARHRRGFRRCSTSSQLNVASSLLSASRRSSSFRCQSGTGTFCSD